VALGPDPARALLRAGLWEHALAAVPAGAPGRWGEFWLGVLADQVDHSPAAAVPRYTEALG
jgi:hypothetical protein